LQKKDKMMIGKYFLVLLGSFFAERLLWVKVPFYKFDEWQSWLSNRLRQSQS